MLACCLMVLLTSRAAQGGATQEVDLERVIQRVINLPSIEQYYHVDQDPSRKPLIITGARLQKSLKGRSNLRKFDKPVIVLPKTEIIKKKIKAYLEFTKIAIRGDVALVTLKYAVEGVGLNVVLHKQNRSWTVVRSRLWEN